MCPNPEVGGPLPEGAVPGEELDGGGTDGDLPPALGHVAAAVEDGDGQSGRQGQVAVLDGQLDPLVPLPPFGEVLVRGEDGAVEGLAPLRTGDPAPVPLLPVPVVTVAVATVGVLVVAFVTVLLICTFWKLL